MATFCTKSRVTAALLVLGAGSAIAANNPLPGFAQRTQPIVFFVLDTSGSMNACDGGLINPTQDLTRNPNGGYLYNPLADAGDDGACGARNGNAPYNITRLEATKLSVSRILDADSNGVIDSGDEELLRMHVGVTNYPDFTETNYNVGPGRDVGSTYLSVWNFVDGLRGSGGTPTGPALAGARARFLQKCYDGDPNTACPLGQNLQNGNDKATACRDYYVVLLTDGEPNTNSAGGVGFDPLPVARDLQNKNRVLGSEVAPPVRVRTFAIGLGADVTGIGSNPRGYINCSSFWGSRNGSSITDANKDGDNNPDTMKANAAGAETAVGNACNTDDDMNAAVKGLGNGFFATDARELSDTFKRIMNAIQAGTYSRSEPSFSSGTGTTAADGKVFASYFDIKADSLDWRGHLRKYRFDAQTGRYVDCDSAVTASNPVKPCWDAGGWYGQQNLSPFNYTGLFERDWSTRRLFVVNPANLDYDPDLQDEKVTRPVNTTAPTVINIVSRLPANYQTPQLPANNQPLYAIAGFTQLSDADSTFTAADAIPNASLVTGIQTLSFTAGRPTSTFSSGAKRCGTQTCTDADGSAKLGDSFNSRPVVVGPPVAVTLDAEYNVEFRERVLDTYAGNDQVYANGTAADPCDGARNSNNECSVAFRRTLVYLPANDGALHAFDEKTGEELWAFVPPGHLNKLGRAQDGRTTYIDGLATVRDVRFPCERGNTGACNANQSRPFADGKWHTVLVQNQGMGGNFIFALDITNPVKPIFLWEYRKPQKMGLTVARAAIAELSRGLPDLTRPGSAVFVPGGYFPAAGEPGADLNDTSVHPHFFSLRSFDGEPLDDHHMDPQSLADARTAPAGIVNAMTGAPAPVDGNLDGSIDRVYFGDREGRLWKAYNLTDTGDFTLKLFFDPAAYDRVSGGEVGQPVTPQDPLSGLDAANDRMTLRGPIFFPPDVTRDAQGNLLVAFGSGNMLDPLSSPAAQKNFVWVVQDNPVSDSDRGARASRCGSGTVSTYTAPGGRQFTNVQPLSDLLTGSPLIFKGILFYPEFDGDRDGDGDVCEDDYLSRVVAVNAFDCGQPGILPFRDAQNQPSATKEYPGALVTGVQIDPSSGTLFTQTSLAGNPPSAEAVPGLGETQRILGRRQPY